ncbi:chymotrypsin-2-like [Prorops nasuta]|uniref:chymotrypsin-2-like n=1 Tax=Prorops nasuta TaxID=863751 RepID=UPI0034CF443B
MQVLTILLYAGLIVYAYGIPSGRIVGGKDSSEGKYPYQVSIQYIGRHNCGGSIINKRYILTAAHCLRGRIQNFLTIVAGITRLDSAGDEYKVESFLIHPEYDPVLIINDIGLIRVNEDIRFSEKVQTIELASKDPDEEVFPVILTGWGWLSIEGDHPNNLQVIQLYTTNQGKCKSLQPKATDRNICTLTKKGEGACKGDSGGPLVNLQGKQIGIVSYGIPCAFGYPDVYTRVSYFYDFIMKNINL